MVRITYIKCNSMDNNRSWEFDTTRGVFRQKVGNTDAVDPLLENSARTSAEKMRNAKPRTPDVDELATTGRGEPNEEETALRQKALDRFMALLESEPEFREISVDLASQVSEDKIALIYEKDAEIQKVALQQGGKKTDVDTGPYTNSNFTPYKAETTIVQILRSMQENDAHPDRVSFVHEEVENTLGSNPRVVKRAVESGVFDWSEIEAACLKSAQKLGKEFKALATLEQIASIISSRSYNS